MLYYFRYHPSIFIVSLLWLVQSVNAVEHDFMPIQVTPLTQSSLPDPINPIDLIERNSVTSHLLFSNDDNQIIATINDNRRPREQHLNKIYRWDVMTGQLSSVEKVDDNVMLQATPNEPFWMQGNTETVTIKIASINKTIELDLSDYKTRGRYEAVFSPNAAFIFIRLLQEGYQILQLDVDTGQLVRSFDTSKLPVFLNEQQFATWNTENLASIYTASSIDRDTTPITMHVSIWDISTETEIQNFTLSFLLASVVNHVGLMFYTDINLTFSTDLHKILLHVIGETPSTRDGGTLPGGVYREIHRASSIWDITTGEHIATLPGEEQQQPPVFINNQYILANSIDSPPLIIDANTGQVLYFFGENVVPFVTAAPNGQHIVSISETETGYSNADENTYENLILWDVNSGEKLRIFDDHAMTRTPIQFTSDSELFVAHGYDGMMLWNLNQDQPLAILENTGADEKIKIFPNKQQYVAYNHKKLSVRDIYTHRIKHTAIIPQDYDVSALLPIYNPNYIFTTDSVSRTATDSSGFPLGYWIYRDNKVLRDIKTGETLIAVTGNSVGGQTSVLPWLIVSPTLPLALHLNKSRGSYLKLVDLETLTDQWTITDFDSDMLAFYGDSSSFITQRQGIFELRDTATGEIIQTYNDLSQLPEIIGEVISSETMETESPIISPVTPPQLSDISADGRWQININEQDNNTIQLWDLTRNELVRTFRYPNETNPERPIQSLTFSALSSFIYAEILDNSNGYRTLQKWYSGIGAVGEPETNTCIDQRCKYNLTLDEVGFYVASISLPEQENEGQWGISINNSSGSNPGGFSAGSVLREDAAAPSFISFHLTQPNSVSLQVVEYLGILSELELSIFNSQQQMVFGPKTVAVDTIHETGVLAAGYYIVTISSLANDERSYFGININGDNIQSYVDVGGMIDNRTGLGFIGFPIIQPMDVTFTLLYGGNYHNLGASGLYLEIFRILPDGSLLPVFTTF